MTVKHAVKIVGRIKRGFTLIELLVVVLIIGILAVVAVPQYQKAVRKAKFAEVGTMFSSLSRAVDMWLLENGGYPDSPVLLTGTNSLLDIEIPCDTTNNAYCSNVTGSWAARCYSWYCLIVYLPGYDAFGNANQNSWFAPIVPNTNGDIEWVKNSLWTLDVAQYRGNERVMEQFCQWWAENYGKIRMTGSAVLYDCP